MNDPDTSTFIAEAERALGFLRNNGFISTEADREGTALTAQIVFRGQHIAISVSLDRRDDCVDCYITRIVAGKPIRNDISGGYWGPLHAFLVKHRGYRGGFKEFRSDEDKGEWYVKELNTYARALQKLAPDIVTDSERIFGK